MNIRAGRLLEILAANPAASVNSAYRGWSETQAAEAFYVQKCLPGHFDNMRETHAEMLGGPPTEPVIV